MKFNVWTLLFQITNFIVLLVILRRILYRPVREIMERRRGAVERQIQDAGRMKREAQALKDEYEAEMNGLKDRKVRMLEELQEEMNEERRRLIGKAREEADRMVVRERALVNEEKRTFEAEMKNKVLDSVAIFSSNLLRDIADETLHKAVFRKFLEGIGRVLPVIEEAAGKAETLSIDLAAAYPLRAEDIERVREGVRSGTARKVVVNTALEPALIAGVRMKAGDQVLDSSIAGQIQALKERLKEAA